MCFYLNAFLEVRRQDRKNEKSWYELVSLGTVEELQCVYSCMQQLALHSVSSAGHGEEMFAGLHF